MLASSQDKAVLDTLGIESRSSSSSESSDEETDHSDRLLEIVVKQCWIIPCLPKL